MKEFLGEDFLLNSPTAVKLYHDYAKDMPIMDYHCHIVPQEIAEDKQFSTITEMWLGADHYKWRQMRNNGVEEQYITGDASDFDKFEKWAETLEKAIGNPLYHWSHLELKNYFGYTKPLSKKTAREAFDFCNEKLKDPSFSARSIMKRSKVELICTTDDPADSLEWHQKIAQDKDFDSKVLPTWRPDGAMNIDKEGFLDYLDKLSSVSGVVVTSMDSMKSALVARLNFFHEVGCRVSDHGLDYLAYAPINDSQAQELFQKRLDKKPLTDEEVTAYKTYLMEFMAGEYNKRQWVMQIHFGCKRNNNSAMFQKLGADTGFDCISTYTPSAQVADFLNACYAKDNLPKTILYSLNPADNAFLGTVMGCFADSSARGKVQQGSAWWFNDHKTGMIEQMTSLANLGLLGNFLGMLTDSRSFLSYVRHEYFRRILCNMVGTWVEEGEFPADEETLKTLIQDISYGNVKNYFHF